MQGKKKKNSWLTHRNQISCWFLNLKFISQKKNTPSTYQNKNLFPLRKNKQKKNKCTHTQQNLFGHFKHYCTKCNLRNKIYKLFIINDIHFAFKWQCMVRENWNEK